MVSRRGVLAGIGVAGLGGGVYATNENVRNRVNSIVEDASQEVAGPPPTETMIDSVEGPKEERLGEDGVTEQYISLIKRVEFYESGAAQIYPKADHGCYDALAFRHEATNLGYNGDGTTDTSDALATWELGEFDEVLTVDMAGAISNKGNYPNRVFVLEVVSTDGGCIGISTETEVEFEVPESYMP